MSSGTADLVDDAHLGAVVEWQPASGRAPMHIHPVWLLESCTCERCRYPSTGRRRQEALLVSTDVRPLRVWVDGGFIHAEWPDGHHSVTVPPSNSSDSDGPSNSDGRAPAVPTAGSASGPDLDVVTWDVDADRGARGKLLSEILASLLADGAVLVSGVPTNEEALLGFARWFGPVRPSGYGEVWEIDTTAESGPVSPDAVTSLDGLSPHTDLPYRQLPPGVQFLLSCRADGVGGASTLVDGRRVVEQLEADDLRTLMEVPVRYGFGPVDKPIERAPVEGAPLDHPSQAAPSHRTVRYDHVGPVVEFDADGVLSVLRHAPGLIEDLDPDPDRFARLHRALSNLTALTNDPANQIVHRLEPGELLIFDNHRMLHGRTPVELAPGERRYLLGLYIDRDDVVGAGVVSGQSS